MGTLLAGRATVWLFLELELLGFQAGEMKARIWMKLIMPSSGGRFRFEALNR